MIQIDEEFRLHIPALKLEEYAALKASIEEDKGCRDPLVVWEDHNILLDGHNRLSICHDLKITNYEVVFKRFESREAALNWIVDNQLARRNLSRKEMKYLRGKKYNLAKLPHGEGKREPLSSKNWNLKTRDIVAEELGVSGSTISNDSKYADAVDTLAETIDPQVKQDVFRNDIRATDEEVLQLANLAIEQPDIAKQVRKMRT